MTLSRISLQLVAIGMVFFLSCTLIYMAASRPTSLIRERTFQTHNNDPLSMRHHSLSVQPLLHVDEPGNNPMWNIWNRTLGFQKIYAISMPHRTGKRDYLALMGLVSDMEITLIDGVNGSEMHPDGLPPIWKGSANAGEHGCWRAHMNVYEQMLRYRIQSALILEDDADWDVFLRPQLANFARGMRHVQNTKHPLHSPYGDDWDVLTIGHTGINGRMDIDQNFWATRNDPTVIAKNRRTWGRKPNMSAPALSGDHTCVVMQVSRLTGTAAYAISLRGAMRLLYDQAFLPNGLAIDMAISNMCHRNAYSTPFCYGTYPMLIGRYRAIGRKARDSDRRTSSNEAKSGSGGGQSRGDRLEAESEFTVFPLSLNIGRLLRGVTVVIANDPLSDMLTEVDLRTFELPRGGGVWVRQDEYVIA